MLETERLYVREQTLEDIDRLYEIYEGDSIKKFIEPLYEDRQEELAHTKAYIHHMYRFYGYGMWVVCLKENDMVIGRAGLGNRRIDDEDRLEIGYVIAEEYQKKGYAFEVCKAICDFAQNRLYAQELVCITRKDNEASIRLIKKLDFEYFAEIVSEADDLTVMVCYVRHFVNGDS